MKMKNLLLLLMVGVFGLASCSKDDEDGLVGTWEGVSIFMSSTYEGETDSETITYTDANRPTVTLNADNTYTVRSNEGSEWVTETGTYAVNGNKITLGNENTFDFTVSSSQLVLSTQETWGEGVVDEVRMTFRRK